MKTKIIYANGDEKEVVVGPRAQVELERRYDILLTDAIDGSSGKARVEYIYFVAWAAAHFAGQEPETDYDKWLMGIADVIPQFWDEKANPTRRARRPAKSSS